MLCYHSSEHADEILAGGFGDAEGYYGRNCLYCGVWLADQPLDGNEGADGETVLCIEIPTEVFEQFEWIEESKGYRQSLIPAEVVNRYAPPKIWYSTSQ